MYFYQEKTMLEDSIKNAIESIEEYQKILSDYDKKIGEEVKKNPTKESEKLLLLISRREMISKLIKDNHLSSYLNAIKVIK